MGIGKHVNPRLWASLKPLGLGQQRPNNYMEIVRAGWENRDRAGYAWRILNEACCDGCALGTKGMHDWTIEGTHLCNIRLRLLRLNTAPPFDPAELEDVEALSERRTTELREMGRIPHPMVRRKGDRGFRRASWDEALDLIAERVEKAGPDRVAGFLTSRGMTNESYYARPEGDARPGNQQHRQRRPGLPLALDLRAQGPRWASAPPPAPTPTGSART